MSTDLKKNIEPAYKLELGERIRKAIKRLDITDTAFSLGVGVTKQTVSGYINGVREPSASFIANCVRVYNINATWLVSGQGEMLLSDSPQAAEVSAMTRDLAAIEDFCARNADNETALRMGLAYIERTGAPPVPPTTPDYPVANQKGYAENHAKEGPNAVQERPKGYEGKRLERQRLIRGGKEDK